MNHWNLRANGSPCYNIKRTLLLPFFLVIVLSLSGAMAFTGSYYSPLQPRPSRIVTFGVRKRLRRVFQTIAKPVSRYPYGYDHQSKETSETMTDVSSDQNMQPMNTTIDTLETNQGVQEQLSIDKPVQVVAIENNMGSVNNKEAHQSFYTLPPVDRKLNDMEQEYRDMLLHFTLYTDRDIMSLRDPRMRAVFQGVAAAAMEPATYRAFEVLYEDLLPLRVAGRVIYKRLKQLMKNSIEERKQEVEKVVLATRLPPDQVEEARFAFVSIASILNGDAYLTRAQLSQSRLGRVATEVLGYDSIDELVNQLGQKNSDKVSFFEIVIGIQNCAEEMCALEHCNPALLTRQIVEDFSQNLPSVMFMYDTRHQRFCDNYDAMVSTFRDWKELVPQSEGRIMDVVRGCFVGAENEKIVDALRIVYVDYQGLRIAGDIIFSLVSSVMNERRRRFDNRRN